MSSVHLKTTALGAILLSGSALSAQVYENDGTALDIFGRVEAGFMNSHALAAEAPAHQSGNNDSSIMSAARLGLAGRAKINDTVYAIAMTEWDMPSTTADSTRVRYQFVGVDAQQYGILTFGRGDGAYYTVAGTTDIFTKLDLHSNDHYLMGEQRSGQLMYSLSSLGWDLRMSLQTAVDSLDNTPFCVDSGAAFAVSTRLKSDITITYGASYERFNYEKNTHEQLSYFGEMYAKGYGDNTADFAGYGEGRHPSYKVNKGVAVAYGTLGKGLYTGFVYNVTRYKNLPHHLYAYEAVLDYAGECGLGVNLGFSLQQYHGSSLIRDLNTGIYYKMGEAVRLYAEAQFDLDGKPQKLYPDSYIAAQHLGENRYVLGAQYYF